MYLNILFHGGDACNIHESIYMYKNFIFAASQIGSFVHNVH